MAVDRMTYHPVRSILAAISDVGFSGDTCRASGHEEGTGFDPKRPARVVQWLRALLPHSRPSGQRRQATASFANFTKAGLRGAELRGDKLVLEDCDFQDAFLMMRLSHLIS
jgi:hypothetical protein